MLQELRSPASVPQSPEPEIEVPELGPRMSKQEEIRALLEREKQSVVSEIILKIEASVVRGTETEIALGQFLDEQIMLVQKMTSLEEKVREQDVFWS